MIEEQVVKKKLKEIENFVSVKLDVEDSGMVIETVKPDDFYSRLPAVILENDIKVENIHSPDDNLQAVFQYLVK